MKVDYQRKAHEMIQAVRKERDAALAEQTNLIIDKGLMEGDPLLDDAYRWMDSLTKIETELLFYLDDSGALDEAKARLN